MDEIALFAEQIRLSIPNTIQIGGKVSVSGKEPPFFDKKGRLFVVNANIYLFLIEDGKGVTRKTISSFLQTIGSPAFYIVHNRSNSKLKFIGKFSQVESTKEALSSDLLNQLIREDKPDAQESRISTFDARPSTVESRIQSLDARVPTQEMRNATLEARAASGSAHFDMELGIIHEFVVHPNAMLIPRVGATLDRLINSPLNRIDPKLWRSVGISALELIPQVKNTSEILELLRILARTAVYLTPEEISVAVEQFILASCSDNIPMLVGENFGRLAYALISRLEVKAAQEIVNKLSVLVSKRKNIPPSVVDLFVKFNINLRK